MDPEKHLQIELQCAEFEESFRTVVHALNGYYAAIKASGTHCVNKMDTQEKTELCGFDIGHVPSSAIPVIEATADAAKIGLNKKDVDKNIRSLTFLFKDMTVGKLEAFRKTLQSVTAVILLNESLEGKSRGDIYKTIEQIASQLRVTPGSQRKFTESVLHSLGVTNKPSLN